MELTYKMLENAKKFEHAFKVIILYSFRMGTMIGDLQMRMIGRLVENLLSF